MPKMIKVCDVCVCIIEPLPFERYDKVLPVAGSTHLGFEKAHLTLSATK